MQIIKGKLPSAKKVVVYGPEGIGKSTFAAQFPDPVFIDTEGSTKDMDVARFEKATSWQLMLEQIRYAKATPGACKTLVIDTIDWAEQLCIEDLCARNGKKGIEDFGYGNGYVYAKEEFGRFLNLLSEVIDTGIHVVLTAHAQIRKFEQPDEMGAYDRYELKLGKKTSSQTSPLVKEWADMLLFCNYKTLSVAVDDKGKKHKAQGGRRIMYTAHHPCWDAKNRYGLPEEMPFEYASIAHIIEGTMRPVQEPVQQSIVTPPVKSSPEPAEEAKTASPVVPDTAGQQIDLPLCQTDEKVTEKPSTILDQGIPKALRDLMELNHVDEWDIQGVVAARGYFPADMPIRDYPEDFISGVLVGAWDQVYAMIQEAKKNEEIPFNV